MATYSFSDASLVIKHPSLGTITVTGQGIGTVNFNMVGDRTVQDVAADGRVMTSKIKDRRATFALQIQQDSEVNQSLLRWFNYLEAATTSEWARMTGMFIIPGSAEKYSFTNGAFQKLPDRTYGAQGQLQGWTLMAGDCQQDVL
jgi:hypothetical protein